MTSLVLMYVFFDKNGDIKAITQVLDEHLSITFSVAMFPFKEVEMFLTAEKNTFDYLIQKIKTTTRTTYVLVKKKTDISYIRTLDSYLSKIEDVSAVSNVIVITNNITNRQICVEVNKKFRQNYMNDSGSEDEQQVTVTDFFNQGESTIYLTRKNNPYQLLFSFSFTVRNFLTSDKMYFPYIGEYNEASAYTKGIIDGYGYREVK